MNSTKGNIGIIKLIFNLRLVLVLGLSFVSIFANAQYATVKETKDAVVKSLQSNNINQLISTFSDPIELSLPNLENSYSKKQASMVVSKFFETTTIKSFTVRQTGRSTGGAEFIIGDLVTNKGNYQVYFLVTLIDAKAYLHLIEFESI